MNRRQFLGAAALGVAQQAISSSPPAPESIHLDHRAILFDGFPIFDPRPVFALAEELFPGHGKELTDLWKNRQFEYTWLRTLTGHYADFPSIIRDALKFAAESLKLEIKQSHFEQLIGRYFQLQAWPDVQPALKQLKEQGIKLGFLSNFSEAMLRANIKNAGLEDYFEPILSTDRVRAFKPDPRAYQMGINALKLPRENIVFAAFAGWDAAGAKSFGYPTFWVNRLNSLPEELGLPADGTGGMHDLVKFMNS